MFSRSEDTFNLCFCAIAAATDVYKRQDLVFHLPGRGLLAKKLFQFSASNDHVTILLFLFFTQNTVDQDVYKRQLSDCLHRR